MTDAPVETTAKRRCKARSKQTGKQCGQFVAEGFTVCKWHGAGSPDAITGAKHRTELVKARAQGRLEGMVDAAIDRLEELSTQDAHLPTAFNAARHILDRGLGAVRGSEERSDSRPQVVIGVMVGGTDAASDVQVIDAERIDGRD